MISFCQKSWSNFLFVPPFSLTERTFWRQQPWERCRKHVPWGEKLPQASESLFTTSCACYFHQNRALSFSLALFFLCFWQEVVIVKHWLHCAQQCGESLAVHSHREDKTWEMARWKEGKTPFSLKTPDCFIDFEGVSVGRVEKPAMSPNFPNLWSSAVLHQDQLEDRWSLAGTFVIIYWVWCIPHIEGEDRKSINWIGLPGPGGGLLTLACMAQAQLPSIKPLLLLLFEPLNWISPKGLNKKERYIAYGFCIPQTLHLPCRQICNHI